MFLVFSSSIGESSQLWDSCCEILPVDEQVKEAHKLPRKIKCPGDICYRGVEAHHLPFVKILQLLT